MIKYPIPTGYLFVDDYANGKLETLSIGDYGKHVNVKADFLPSLDEERGLVTCGNAILEGSKLSSEPEIKIKGLPQAAA